MKKLFISPVILSDITPDTETSVIGEGTGQGTEGMTFDEWMEDIVGSYESLEDALKGLDVNGDEVLDEIDFKAWLAKYY